jgi:hypothetical protein
MFALLSCLLRLKCPLLMPQDTETSPAPKPSFRDILGGALFYIGIPAATLYPLGFMALTLHIWRDAEFPYNWASSGFDFSMLWFAVSLVPQAVVVGTGIRLMLITLITTTLSMSIASIVLYLLRKRELRRVWSDRQRREETLDSLANLGRWERRFWYLSLLFLLPLLALLVVSGFPFDSWYDVPFYAGYFVFSAIGGFIIGYMRFRAQDRWLHHGLAFAFVGSIFAALCLSALELPDLPYVEVQAKATSWPDTLSGSPFRLLSGPNSGYWYVYNQQDGLLALQQDDVSSVRYWDQSKRRAPTVNPAEDGQVNSD